ncbi:MAG: ribokinase [uncultured bacterium]|nr:MAG: ribokinase [uncultured bacterium]
MSEILTIGAVTQDIFFPTSEGVAYDTPEDLLSQKKLAFELGSKCHIAQRHEALGGCSANVACGLAKLGEDVSMYGCIGDDAVGKWISKELGKIGVNLSLVCVQNNCQSDLSAIVVDEKSSDRVIFTNQIANQKLIVQEEKIGRPHWIFVGDLTGEWQKNIDTIISTSNKNKIKVAFNPRQSTIHEDVKKIIETITHCEILFVNKDEAVEIVSGCGDIAVRELLENEEYLVKILHRLGARMITITDGIRGAWAYDGHRIIHAEALLTDAVDSTGAGDAFTSGFFTAHLKRMDLETCLRWGVANSSNSLKEYGGQAGLLGEKEIEILANKVSVKLLN